MFTSGCVVILEGFFDFDVRIREEGEFSKWEDRPYMRVSILKDSPYKALQDYLKILDEMKSDTSKIVEGRVNYKGSPQGYYYDVPRKDAL